VAVESGALTIMSRLFRGLERLHFQLAMTDATRVSDMPRESSTFLIIPDAGPKNTSNRFAVTEKTLFQDSDQSARKQL
jgi:hypothetical protein